MTRFFTATAFFLTVGLSAGLCSQAVARDAKPFAFPDTAYFSASDAADAARVFIRDELLNGTPLSLAERKLEAANMACADVPDRQSATCTFHAMEGGDGATLSEVWWTMKLESGADNRLDAAHFDQSRFGFAP
jgi:hypothetical protein